jgi:hypothetical protein
VLTLLRRLLVHVAAAVAQGLTLVHFSGKHLTWDRGSI